MNNGKGYIKEYNDEGVLYFEGELLNGQRNGKGKQYFNYTLIFEGEYLYSHKLNYLYNQIPYLFHYIFF